MNIFLHDFCRILVSLKQSNHTDKMLKKKNKNCNYKITIGYQDVSQKIYSVAQNIK
jgi:hypothetical protein